jgi:hypothetical protein
MELVLKGINRPFAVEYEGNEFQTLAAIPEGAQVKIVLPKIQVQTEQVKTSERRLTGLEVRLGQSYVIKVRQYMTKPSTPDFDFMEKWNNNIPMPFRVMTGKVVKETRGMVMMDLHCEPFKTDYCMRCGRALTHPVSRLYGIGPECGGHAHINPFETEEQLRAALDDVRAKLADVKWRGWIIKSAILEAFLKEEEQDGME